MKPPSPTSVELGIQGMSCASCVQRVQNVLQGVDGVDSARVNLANGRAWVELNNPELPVESLVAAVVEAGYAASLVRDDREGREQEEQAKEQEYRTLRKSFIAALLFTLPIFILDMGGHIVPALHHWLIEHIGQQALYYLYFALASLVQFGPALRFYRTGWKTLLQGSPDMNSLVMVGTSAAYGYSVVATFVPEILPEGTLHVYYEASAMIVTLVLLGRWMEARARGRTGEAIQRLLSLQPDTAWVLRGTEQQIPVDEIRVGELVRVRPGEKVALDGVVVDGESWVEESMITGEPVPVRKASGSEVVGGTLNQNGSLLFRVTRTGNDTVLSRIVKMVEQAQAAKLPIQSLVDRVTAVFVPVVIGLALLTFITWMVWGPSPALSLALVNAVAVLIIACPCAMGLATPTSIMVGTGKAAEAGILFRRGEALQWLRDADTVAFDKTGTLTAGKPTLTDIHVLDGFDRSDVLTWVASIEQLSEHPIARAIVEAANQEKIQLHEVTDFVAESGLGITAKVAGRQIRVGADRYLRENGLQDNPLLAVAGDWGQQGKTPVYVAIDGRYAAVIGVADKELEDAVQTVQALHGLGLRVVMVTGDNRNTAQAVADRLGIDEVHAEVLPEGKVEVINKLQSQGRKVVFVGDGINDAPALAHADTGIAIGTGTDVAIESADVVLISDRLDKLPYAIRLSRATLDNIRQNLFWAFGYNALLIPVAAGGLYPFAGILLSPVLAAGAMAASSVCVLLNALRLKKFNG